VFSHPPHIEEFGKHVRFSYFAKQLNINVMRDNFDPKNTLKNKRLKLEPAMSEVNQISLTQNDKVPT
jgi:hypothetical protein